MWDEEDTLEDRVIARLEKRVRELESALVPLARAYVSLGAENIDPLYLAVFRRAHAVVAHLLPPNGTPDV